MTDTAPPTFTQLIDNPALLKVLNEVGYEHPTPIQAETIPLIAAGEDVLGQAQTGTGKTAAFALPLLANLDLKQKEPQVLVLAPTRELAIQVAEAFQRYAAYIKRFSCTACLWRPGLFRTNQSPAPRCACCCRHAWANNGSHAQRHIAIK